MPVKVVGSISPVDGNTPSFVVAKVAPGIGHASGLRGVRRIEQNRHRNHMVQRV